MTWKEFLVVHVPYDVFFKWFLLLKRDLNKSLSIVKVIMQNWNGIFKLYGLFTYGSTSIYSFNIKWNAPSTKKMCWWPRYTNLSVDNTSTCFNIFQDIYLPMSQYLSFQLTIVNRCTDIGCKPTVSSLNVQI